MVGAIGQPWRNPQTQSPFPPGASVGKTSEASFGIKAASAPDPEGIMAFGGHIRPFRALEAVSGLRWALEARIKEDNPDSFWELAPWLRRFPGNAFGLGRLPGYFASQGDDATLARLEKIVGPGIMTPPLRAARAGVAAVQGNKQRFQEIRQRMRSEHPSGEDRLGLVADAWWVAAHPDDTHARQKLLERLQTVHHQQFQHVLEPFLWLKSSRHGVDILREELTRRGGREARIADAASSLVINAVTQTTLLTSEQLLDMIEALDPCIDPASFSHVLSIGNYLRRYPDVREQLRQRVFKAAKTFRDPEDAERVQNQLASRDGWLNPAKALEKELQEDDIKVPETIDGAVDWLRSHDDESLKKLMHKRVVKNQLVRLGNKALKTQGIEALVRLIRATERSGVIYGFGLAYLPGMVDTLSDQDADALAAWWLGNPGPHDSLEDFRRQWATTTDPLSLRIQNLRASRFGTVIVETNFCELSQWVASTTTPHFAPLPAPFPETFPSPAVVEELPKQLRDRQVVSAMGRTLLLEDDEGHYIAVKVARDGEDLSSLSKEAAVLSYFNEHKGTLGLVADYPEVVPLVDDNPVASAQRFPEDWRRMIESGGETIAKDPTRVYVYRAPKEYFRYINDPSQTEEEFFGRLARNLHDLGKLAKHGVYSTALIDAFHNRTAVRADGGRYLWMTGVMGSNGNNVGTGRLDAWTRAVRFPNLRVSGPADFEEFTTIQALGREGNPFLTDNQSGISLWEGGPRHALLTMSLMGDIFLAVDLLVGSWARANNTLDWTSELANRRLKRRMTELWSAFAEGMEAPAGALARVLSGQDLQRRARQMSFFMGADDPYAEFVSSGEVPEGLITPDIRASLRSDAKNFIDTPERRGFYADGEHPDLGAWNGAYLFIDGLQTIHALTASLVAASSSSQKVSDIP